MLNSNIDISTANIPLPPENPSTSMLKPSKNANVPGIYKQSVRSKHQNNQILKFHDMFTNQRYVKFYSVKSTNEADLTKLNMFHVDKAFKEAIGNYEKLNENYAEKSWTVAVKSAEQGNKLKTMQELLKNPIEVTPHEHLNQSQGVITCNILKGCSDKDIAEGLADEGVIRCYRIIKNAKSPDPQPTATFILTFNTPNHPDRICIRTGMYEKVRPYISYPRQCKNCFDFSHGAAKCRNETICPHCGETITENHTPDTCTQPLNCKHCKEPHSANSRTCPRYILEKETLAIKSKEQLTYPEAKKKAANLLNTPNKTYSSVVRAITGKPRSVHAQDNTNNIPNISTTHDQPTTSNKRPLLDRPSSEEEAATKRTKTPDIPDDLMTELETIAPINEKTTPDEPTRLTEGSNKSHTKDQQPNLSQTHNRKSKSGSDPGSGDNNFKTPKTLTPGTPQMSTNKQNRNGKNSRPNKEKPKKLVNY